ncbi:ClpXP adapter SpxH family protein [Salsuginibacillus kocurii]|uniref:ClpXP adapter SpxH family protein n=1 Tax=Salsuginibacillus kocurii TaxID=427078 RepID=UPI000373FED7|nr:ClpXP adapter SpxH family protein [Salsuginibacillus kocurii]
MSEDKHYLFCDNETGTCDGLPINAKKVELYVFTDPLCPECWAFEPKLKKLKMEYGHYLTIRFFVAGHLQTWNICEQTESYTTQKQKDLASQWEETGSRTGMSCDGDLWLEDPISSACVPSLAIKAAEMQGRQLATIFLRKLREALFLNKRNIEKEQELLLCAENAGLDLEEFKKDLHSNGAIKALQCDMRTTREMEVEKAPTFVFFNDCIEDAGLKVCGLYDYAVYVNILSELVGEHLYAEDKVDLPDFLKQYKYVATTEVAEVYDLSINEAECKLKQLQLQQKVEKVPVKYGTFWRYLD